MERAPGSLVALRSELSGAVRGCAAASCGLKNRNGKERVKSSGTDAVEKGFLVWFG